MKYKFEDGTGDKKYFTIVPNYILNHSSAIDKALYLDIKRAAGNGGRCFMTEETMCKRNKIGRGRLHKSLKYLLDNKWIEFIGLTPSKTRPIKTYKVSDIWEKNISFYHNKKIPSKSAVSKDTVQKLKDTVQNSSKIPSKTHGIRRTITKEEPIKKNTRKKYSSIKDITKKDILEISEKYRVSVGFVNLQLEKMTNWLGAKGKKYKNYKRGLMNWVLSDTKNGVETRRMGYKVRPLPRVIDETLSVPVSTEKWEEIKKDIYAKVIKKI